MNRHLARAIIAAFHEADSAIHYDKLARYDIRDWRNTFHWLDAAGLALYFLHRVKSLQIQNVVPSTILAELEQRLADNERQTASLFVEFVRINMAFQQAGLEYVNLKGFTLVPHYCQDSALRYQMDCDFLLAERDKRRASELLGDLDYVLVAAQGGVMEFKSGMGRIPHMRDLYKPKSQRSIEIHQCGPESTAKLGLDCSAIESRQTSVVNHFAFPALCASRMFIAQAAHLFRHVRSEWTRLSWLLEFRNFVAARRHDKALWDEVQYLAERIPDAGMAIAAAFILCERAFGNLAPEPLGTWAVSNLPVPIASWLERYGDRVLLADHPGTKLYLLLEKELKIGPDAFRLVRKRVFPLHRPTPIAAMSRGSLSQRLVALSFEWRYFFFRLWFHLKESPRYLVEVWRWKRLLNRRSRSDLSSDQRFAVGTND